MFQFLNNMRISANAEIVCLLILGIFLQMSDGSPFQIKQKWETVWGTDLPGEYFSPIVQQIVKTALSIIVAARCGTTYPYVICAMFVIFCLLRDRAPKLMLPWIFIAGMKSICMTFLEALIGVYVCSAFGKIHKACIEFFISKALEIIFAAYLWGSVLSVYQDMERRLENTKILENSEISYIKKMDFKRQRARSLLDESALYKTACLNNFEFKDVPKIILQMLRRADEMSQDSLLGPGMMLASVSNMGSFDNLKTSESLGELECMNLQSTKVIGLDEEENLSPPERALKFLKMTWSDVRRVQRKRMSSQNDLFSINSDIWFHVTDSDTHIYKPKQARTEIFIRKLPEFELDEDYIYRRKNLTKIYNIKLGVSLFNLIKKNELDYSEDEESLFDGQEETEEEEEDEERDDLEMSQIFMSNIKEEKPVNRIGLNITPKQFKGRAYSKLYRKNFMSVIGPEVFDRATKLPKVTSFTIMKLHSETISSKSHTSTNSKTVPSQTQTSNLNEKYDFPDGNSETDVRISPGKAGEIKQDSVHPLTEKGTMKEPIEHDDKEESKPEIEELESQTTDNVTHEDDDDQAARSSSPNSKSTKIEETRLPCYRKRRIRIKWIGNLKGNDLTECASTNSSFSNNSNDSSESEHPPERDPDKDIYNHQRIKTPPSQSGTSSEKSDNNDKGMTQDVELHFLRQLLHKPLPEVIRKYYDLKSRVYTRRKSMTFQKQLEFTTNLYKMYCLKRFEDMCEFGRKHNKVWKSKVLKTAEANQQPITGDFLNVIDNDVINKLLRYQYLYLMRKMKKNISNGKAFLKTDAKDNKERRESHSSKEKVESDSSKPGNELCCRSRPENLFHSCIILPEHNVNDNNKRNFFETPSEHSIEVCHKDLTNGEVCNSEQMSTSFGGCSNEGGCQTLADETEFFEDAENDFLYSQGSDEPISLYYSKAADLASPLLDMKKFIYPDHIHYSYKHVHKKGFDVNISGGLPLLVQSQALTTNTNLQGKEISPKPESEITKRPMDLSFAKTNAFAEWQNSDQNVLRSPLQLSENSRRIKTISLSEEVSKKKKERCSGKKKTHDGETNAPGKAENRTFLNSHHVYFIQNNIICEKPKKIQLNKKEHCAFAQDEEDRKPVQISSSQLHSNKGRISSTYSPALRLEENKKEEKKKVESQEKRINDMLAKLEREILFQNKNGFNSNIS